MNAHDADLILAGAAAGAAAAHLYFYYFIKNYYFLLWSALLFTGWVAVHSLFSYMPGLPEEMHLRYLLSGPARILLGFFFALSAASMFPGLLRKRDMRRFLALSIGNMSAVSVIAAITVFLPEAFTDSESAWMILAAAFHLSVPLMLFFRIFSSALPLKSAVPAGGIILLFALAVTMPPLHRGTAGKNVLTLADMIFRLCLFPLFEFYIISLYRKKNKLITFLHGDLKKALKEKRDSLKITHSILEEEEKAFGHKMKLASKIQEIMLPALPYSSPILEIDGVYLPHSEVGGDYFDIIPMKSRTVVILADASGHGVPAAFITAMAKITFSDAVNEKRSPEEILYSVNAHLTDIIKTQDYLTVILACISESRVITYANVSHPAAFVSRLNGQLIERWETTGGMFLGSLDNSLQTYGEVSVLLGPGDRLLFITDGLTDQKNPQGETYGADRLEKIFRASLQLSPAQAKERILEDWNSFRGPALQTDDVSFLIIDIK